MGGAKTNEQLVVAKESHRFIECRVQSFSHSPKKKKKKVFFVDLTNMILNTNLTEVSDLRPKVVLFSFDQI